MADFSILLPHVHTAVDLRALRVAVDTLMRHTVHEYELIIDTHQEHEDVCISLNRMARAASCDWLVITTSDFFYSPGWDVALWEAHHEDVLVIGTLTESGYRPVVEHCYMHNFGMSPETYDEAGFNAFAAGRPKPPMLEGWNMPWMINRNCYLDMGGFIEYSGVADLLFFQKWLTAGKQWKRVESYCYHLQCWNSTGNER